MKMVAAAKVKKAENAPYVKTIWWNFGFVVVATAAIITVNTIQNKKVLKSLEELKNNIERIIEEVENYECCYLC